MSKMSKKPFPILQNEEEIEHFVDTADLSEYDFSGWQRVQYEFKKKDAEPLRQAESQKPKKQL